ncbi:acetyl-CoA/propionyl-CoA carboxylase, biotin carboxylase, biotin carboxyl carrier protein [Motilibacter peucedani]|uniref:biotin carboxylase n=1 Tax=Motilibacter peucedani TaxID=598650 RepID=A0A420XM78_9ACTN|nr:biotin carboxylase N-terminal domain-containing protein [Motilibacter peucedani]RKS71509.1 acetyl-CoA/propionyl-CoA carboxylase, biotin carboxylase, biotin carboxyl carrier protein [Motilibacter peucedani]
MRKVLIANRGEIAVRVARACRDAGIASVAVYAIPDRDAMHVRIADEAYSLEGSTPGESYLDIAKLLRIAEQSGADAVHPGYGFLSENADFAEAVIGAGLTWVGPPPNAIRSLGDKVTARHIAEKVGAPLVPGTPDPVPNAAAVVDFARQNGLPIAIKAAFGGGGRGMKVARTMEEIPELYDSAVREAVTAFGRGECFVERYLDRPRHVETQCLADAHGGVVVVSTRDCSLQRRHQKVVEEAPAPFLSAEQNATLYSASKAILREAGYVGAGTCEFLVGTDGTISFLEVNTRLQVEHPVSEEVSGIDLVLEQFRLAEGEPLGYDDPEVRGHSIEFRVNGEDPSRNWLPAPGRVTRWRPPSGPGVRLDTGVAKNSEVSGAFDSLLCKLVVTGATREQAIGRARRALAEFQIEGLPTALPFHRAVLQAPDFTDEPFRVHTRWIETEARLDLDAYAGPHVFPDGQADREHVVVEVGGKRLEVVIPEWVTAGAASVASASGRVRPRVRRGRSASSGTPAVASGDAVTAPMQGTIVKVAVEDGQQVAEGDLIVVLEAMKMEQPLTAPKAGVVTGLSASVGDTVASGAKICDVTTP